jgi:hypothetical protein
VLVTDAVDGQIAMSNPGISKIEFAADSLLEGRVTSEPVSEMGFSGAGELPSRFQDVYGWMSEA